MSFRKRVDIMFHFNSNVSVKLTALEISQGGNTLQKTKNIIIGLAFMNITFTLSNLPMFKLLPSERYDLKKEFPVPFYGLDVSGENTHAHAFTHTHS